jgi:hypothetical protein
VRKPCFSASVSFQSFELRCGSADIVLRLASPWSSILSPTKRKESTKENYNGSLYIKDRSEFT